MHPPHLALVHVDWLPSDTFDDLIDSIAHHKLQLVVQSSNNEVYAGIEWLLPTAAVVYISKSYFDGFLKEMGKDHYSLLRNGLKALWGKILGPKALEPTIIASPGKASKDQPYSLVYSIMAETGNGNSFKLLLPRGLSQEEYEEIANGFLDFLEKFHTKTLDASTVEQLNSARVIGSVIPIVYDIFKKDIRVLDPLAGRR